MMKTKHCSNVKRISIFTLVVALCLTIAAQAQIRIPGWRYALVYTYTLTDLGANTGNNITSSFAYGINNSGQAVGEFNFRTKTTILQHGFRTMANQAFMPATSDDLGTVTGDVRSAAFAINQNGIVVGDSSHSLNTSVSWSNSAGSVESSNAFRSLSAGATLENLQGGTNNYFQLYPRGLDWAGRIVGYFKNIEAFPEGPADLWDISHAMFSSCGPGCILPLDVPLNFPVRSEAYGVNSQLDIVGWRQKASSVPPSAFLLRHIGYTVNGLPQWAPTDIVLPGGTWSKGYAVNDKGQVVGESGTATGSQHAFLWKDLNGNGVAESTEIRDLDTIYSSTSGARSVNLGGTAVGYFGGDSSISGNSRASIFLSGGPMLDLNTLVPAGTGRWTLRLATGINDNGQIVGYMEDTSVVPRVYHAFRLDVAGYQYIAW